MSNEQYLFNTARNTISDERRNQLNTVRRAYKEKQANIRASFSIEAAEIKARSIAGSPKDTENYINRKLTELEKSKTSVERQNQINYSRKMEIIRSVAANKAMTLIDERLAILRKRGEIK